MSLKKDLVKVGSVNILVFVSGMLNAFIIPKYLTVLAYSSYKTYLLYIGFIGILHFGFVDGINLYFGGKKKESINKNEVQALFFFILIIELLVCFLLFIIYLIAGSGVILLYLIISIIPLNLNSFLLFYYQAIGDFNSYTKTMLILPITNIVGITFIVAFNLADYHLFIYLYIISYLLSVIYSISINTKITRGHNVISNIKYIINNIFTIRKIIVSGFYLLIGNLLYLLFFDIGRVLIKFLGTEVNFAMYSFSLSMMSAVIIFVNSINKTIYPYMFNYSNSQRGKLTEYLTMLGVASFPLYYGVYYLVLNYIPKYEDALLLTAILMSSIPGILIVKSIYVNQYKVIKLERLFVKDTLIYLSICLPLVLFGFYIYKNIEIVGLLSVLSIYIWAFNPRKSLMVNYNKLRLFVFIFFNVMAYYFVLLLELEILVKLIISISTALSTSLILYKLMNNENINNNSNV